MNSDGVADAREGAHGRADDRLESWKEISAYLKRDIRTLHRWERDEGLPVHRHVHKKRATVYAYRAELERWRRRRQTGRVEPSPQRGRRLLLAVLPFENLSGSADDEYFSDGLTEEVITQLGQSQTNGLGVIARTSVMQYKATRKPLADIARELRVDYVLEGRVRRVGDRLRLTLQLVQVADQTQLWAERYDREIRDVLVLQGELAMAVAQKIGLSLYHPTVAVEAAGSVDPDAFESYLKGRFHWYKLSAQHLDTALDYFHLALEKDPGFALAYEGIAGVWLMRGDAGFLPPGETLMKAKTAALQALQIDDRLAAAHLTLANIRFCNEWDWRGADEEFRRAIRLNPNSADAHFFYGDFLIALGQWGDGTSETSRALELDPFNFFFRCFRGWHLVYRQEYDRAIAQLRKTLEIEPRFSSAHLGLWGAFAGCGSYDEALVSAQRFFESLDDLETCEALAGGSGEHGYRLGMVRAADLLATRAATAHVSAVRIARLYAQAGDTNRALQWLEHAYERRESPLVHLNVGWDWAALRTQHRFKDLLCRIGFGRSRERTAGGGDMARTPDARPSGNRARAPHPVPS